MHWAWGELPQAATVNSASTVHRCKQKNDDDCFHPMFTSYVSPAVLSPYEI